MLVDPFSMVYTALWDMAEATPILTDQVKLRNRIRYDTDNRDPEKRSMLDSDMPELTLISEGLSANMRNSSTTSHVLRRYSWTVMTGDNRITYRMLPVEWALFTAMHKWCTILTSLKWNNKAFVKRTNILDVTDGLIRVKEGNESPRGWAAIWSISVDMYFDTKDIGA